MMYGWGNGTGAFGLGAMLAMMLFGLVVLVAIVLLIVWAVRQSEHRHPTEHPPGQQYMGGQHYTPAQPGAMPPAGQGGPMQPRDPAVDAARERYARGEITKEQLDQIVKDLGY